MIQIRLAAIEYEDTLQACDGLEEAIGLPQR